MNELRFAPLTRPVPAAVVQRKCAGCGSASHAAAPCATCDHAAAAPESVHETLRAPGQPLDTDTRRFMEGRFGQDFAHVRVHSDASAGASAQAIGAAAYTVGSELVFQSGHYRPGSTAGRRLIAHELVHVMQQGGGDRALRRQPVGTLALGAVGDRHEQEADRLADQAMAGPVDTPATGLSDVLQRQPAPPPPAPVVIPSVAPTPAQQAIIDTAARAASIRAQVAMMRTSGTVPPGPPGRDPAAAMRHRARQLAQLMFDWPNPNMTQVGEIVSSIVTRLMRPQAMVAGRGDPECGSRSAYVRGHSNPIVLCPTFFADPPEQQARTMIHEAAHLVGIGAGTLGESYCVVFDCATSCGGFESADSWAHYIHCLSGQTADQPTAVQAPAPPPGGGTPRP